MISQLEFFLHRCAALLALILMFSVYCVAGSESASVVESALELIDPLASDWALGDFDGDQRTDVVLSEGIGQSSSEYLYRVELRLNGREEGSSSFIVASTEALGLNFIVRDIDGDHDQDLVITGRLSGQRIGVWVNDGRGVLAQNLLNLYSVRDDWALHSLHFELPSQELDESASGLLPACFQHTRIRRTVLFSSSWDECSNALQPKFRFEQLLHHLRAPPRPPRS